MMTSETGIVIIFMGSRVEIKEIQVFPMPAVYLDYFIEKRTLFFDLVKYLLL